MFRYKLLLFFYAIIFKCYAAVITSLSYRSINWHFTMRAFSLVECAQRQYGIEGGMVFGTEQELQPMIASMDR